MSRIVQATNITTTTTESTMRRLAQGYGEAGHEITHIVPGEVDATLPTPWGHVITLRAAKLPGSDRRVITDRWRVTERVHELRPDFLEVHDRVSLRGLGMWAKHRGIPSMVVSHERLDRTARAWLPGGACCVIPVQRLADRSNSSLIASFDHVVCTTAWTAQEFDRCGAGNIHRIPTGIDTTNFHPGLFRAQLRNELEVAAEEILLLHVSRLSPDKRNDLTVAALRELLRRGRRARLVIAGDGRGRTTLERSCSGLPVTFLGHIADRGRVGELLATADVVITPGPAETLGLATGEALACGTPVVVHRSSALTELISDSCGAAVAGSGWTMADGIEQVLSWDPVARRAAARRRAEQFPWAKTVEGFLQVHQLEPTNSAAAAA